MTGHQLLNELRMNLETAIENLPEPERAQAPLRELEDRSLWSGRLRRVT